MNVNIKLSQNIAVQLKKYAEKKTKGCEFVLNSPDYSETAKEKARKSFQMWTAFVTAAEMAMIPISKPVPAPKCSSCGSTFLRDVDLNEGCPVCGETKP